MRTLEIEAMFLEKQTLPALSRLMQQVSRKELNIIRHSKTSVTKLLGRVTSIKKVAHLPCAFFDAALLLPIAQCSADVLALSIAAKSGGEDYWLPDPSPLTKIRPFLSVLYHFPSRLYPAVIKAILPSTC